MKRLIRILAVAFMGLILASPIAVYAVANPTSTTVNEVQVFTNVLETGDQVIYARYDINYSSEPTEDASTTFLMAVYDTDGTTLLYTRPVNYYQMNIISVYLTSAQAITVGGAYVVKIVGNPGIFDPLTENVNMDTWILSGGDYSDGSLMGAYLLTQAGILETDWAIDLLSASGKLNTTGGLIFKEAIPGLGAMADEIFETTAVSPSATNVSFNNSYGNVTHNRIGTMNTAFADIGSFLGIGEVWAGVFVSSIGVFVFAGIVFAATHKPEIGVISAALSTIAFAWIGWIPLQALMMGVIIIVILFGIVFILGRLG